MPVPSRPGPAAPTGAAVPALDREQPTAQPAADRSRAGTDRRAHARADARARGLALRRGQPQPGDRPAGGGRRDRRRRRRLGDRGRLRRLGLPQRRQRQRARQRRRRRQRHGRRRRAGGRRTRLGLGPVGLRNGVLDHRQQRCPVKPRTAEPGTGGRDDARFTGHRPGRNPGGRCTVRQRRSPPRPPYPAAFLSPQVAATLRHSPFAPPYGVISPPLQAGALARPARTGRHPAP